MKARLAAAVAAMALVAAATTSGWFGVGPSSAAPTDCVKTDLWGQCKEEVPVSLPGRSASEQLAVANNTGGPSAPASTCGWKSASGWDSVPAELRIRYNTGLYADAPPDAVWQVYYCGNALGSPQPGYLGLRWVPAGGGPASAPVPPEPGVVATLVFARVKAGMVAPTLGSDPPVGGRRWWIRRCSWR